MMRGTLQGGRWTMFLGGRRLVLVGMLVALAGALVLLGARWEWFSFSSRGGQMFFDFVGAAFRPALDYEAGLPAMGADPFWLKALKALGRTLKYAVAGMSLALVMGSVMGVLASEAWWPVRENGQGGRGRKLLGSLRFGVRLVATLLRSVHEFLWMLLFLAAFGTSGWAAVWAIALPFSGILAKVFSEVLDEQDRSVNSPVGVLQGIGGGSLIAFLGGVVPRALPDLLAYFLYRFECAVRSSAVLGFLGIPTLGYVIATSFEDYHLREVWSFLYLMMGLVLLTEWWGARVRRCLQSGAPASRKLVGGGWRELRGGRPRWRFLEMSAALAVVIAVAAWAGGDSLVSELSAERKSENLERFLEGVRPWPVQQGEGWGAVPAWLGEKFQSAGWEGMWRTFLIASAGGIVAAIGAAVLVGLSVRTLASRRPLGVGVGLGSEREEGGLRAVLAGGVRWFFVLIRSVPEYVLAFLLMGLFGISPWPLILALGIHNTGILGRLWGEVLENTEDEAGQLILSQGGERGQALLGGLLPLAFNRMLLFFFYRWESCLREATIMGVLGVVSLGYLIDEAKTRFYYDEIFLYILMGALLVLFGDLVSYVVRGRLRGK